MCPTSMRSSSRLRTSTRPETYMQDPSPSSAPNLTPILDGLPMAVP